MRVWFYNNGGIGLICLHSHYNLDICILQFDNQLEKLCQCYRVLQNLCTRNVPTSSKCYDRAVLLWSSLLFWLLLFQIRKGLGSSRFCCKDSAKPCMCAHEYSECRNPNQSNSSQSTYHFPKFALEFRLLPSNKGPAIPCISLS